LARHLQATRVAVRIEPQTGTVGSHQADKGHADR
jgi:hypothetical protein